MPDPDHTVSLEEQIDQWRSYLRRRQAIHTVDVAELEDHLREQVAALLAAGLAADEAFLVAVKRMGNLDAVSREFAREHSDRLWKQLVVVPADSGRTARAGPDGRRRRLRACGGGGRRHQDPGVVRVRDGPGQGAAGLLRPQHEPVRAAVPDRLFRLETAAGRQDPRLAGRGVRRGGRLRQRVPVRRARQHRGADGAAPADRALAGRGRRLRRPPVGSGRRPDGLHSLFGRAVHLLRADGPRRRCVRGVPDV